MDEVMPQYTKEDFNTEQPYSYIYSRKNDRFEFNRLTNLIAEQAKKVGYIGFKPMLKSYISTQEQKLGQIINNATQFSGQPLELASGDWQADDLCVTRRNAQHGEDIACVHPILPIERLVNADTGIEKLKIAFRKGHIWKEEIYEKKTLASTTGILELANVGIAVNSENARHLISYIHDLENLNFEIIPVKNSVSRLGWIKNLGFSPYVQGIEFDGINTFKNMFESTREEGNFDTWLGMCREIRKTDSVGRILLAASFASVILPVIKKLNFIVHLWGGTEAGKTVALMLAASVWANPNPGSDNGYIQTFNGTQVAIELQSGFVNNLPLILDEFQLVKDKKSFEQIVYMLCEGIGKMRGAKTGGLQKTTTWKNCTLTSGETPISSDSSGGGAVNRIIEIECRDKVFEDAPKVADTVSENYGFAGKLFVTLLDSEDAKEEANRLYKQFYRELGVGSTEKQTMAAAAILTADTLATNWIFVDDRSLTINDIMPYLHSKESVDANARAYDYLYETVIGNKAKFSPDSPDCWGSMVGGYVNVIKRNFNQICEDAGYNPRALASWLKKQQISECEKGRTDKLVKINGKPVRCVRINTEHKYESFDGFEDVEQEELPFD